jgi:hypothetical protein
MYPKPPSRIQHPFPSPTQPSVKSHQPNCSLFDGRYILCLCSPQYSVISWDCGLNSGLCACKAGTLPLYISSPFFFGYFRDGFSGTTFPGWPQTLIFLISATQVAKITGVSHHQHLDLNSCLSPFHVKNSGTFLHR